MLDGTLTSGDESEAENDENAAPPFSLKPRSSTSSSSASLLEAAGTLDTPRASSSTNSANASAVATPEERPTARRKGTGGRLSLLAAAGDDSFSSSTSTGVEKEEAQMDTSTAGAGGKRERSRSAESDLRALGGKEDGDESLEKRRQLDGQVSP